MPRVSIPAPVDSRKLLVQRISASRHLAKSARLHDLLDYLAARVIDDGAREVREQEIGIRVFGRAPDYDTSIDNIVRVHASTLRKRLEQYFADEGATEEVVLEIPKGNYAPVFRPKLQNAAAPQPVVSLREFTPEVFAVPGRQRGLRSLALQRNLLLALCCLLGTAAAYTAFHKPDLPGRQAPENIRAFWSGLFGAGVETDVVADDGAMDLFQELTGRRIGLSQYFDRSYLRMGDSAASVPSDVSGPLTLRRLSSFAATNLVWRLSAVAAATGGSANVRFARDYSFNSLKTHNAVLLGNSRSNPWIEPFESRLTVRWSFDKTTGAPQPFDATQKAVLDPEDGYAGIALLPNLSGSGSVLILSATGGSTMTLAGDYLMDGALLAQLKSSLPAGTRHFETLIRVKRRSRASRDISIAISRPAPDR